MRGHGPGQYVQSLGIDAVVVGDQDSHPTVLARLRLFGRQAGQA